MGKGFGTLAAMAALLAACQAESPAPEPKAKSARRPPEPACQQARRDLSRRERDLAFIFGQDGQAMTERRSWMRLEERQQNEVIETMAIVAACNSEAPVSEVEVIIRDEGGAVLKSTRVEPRTDYRAR